MSGAKHTDDPATFDVAYATVGVIGHIDHGKTSLVGKLTGVDTDTHPEEKRRGITIDLGFAALVEDQYTLAFIDAPGHQKYIGNLLAGVSAVDVGLLVVACDQGIQEQTLEHIAILHSLGVTKLVVALSRIDLCTPARRKEALEEVEVFLSDFGFQDFPIVPTSTQTGEGLEQLKSSLLHAAKHAFESSRIRRQWRLARPFRMPVDRVLNVPGRGLVVAGTPWSGEVHLGDKLAIAGQPGEPRVREIEVHGYSVEHAQFGRRTAVNLTGADITMPSRGDELVAVGAYPRCSRLLVLLDPFEHAPEVKCPSYVQLHTATNSIESRIMGVKSLLPSQPAAVIIEPESPIVATYGQTCLLRRPYPVGSFAGGRVLGVVFEQESLATKNLMSLAADLITSAENSLSASGRGDSDRTSVDEDAGTDSDANVDMSKAATASAGDTQWESAEFDRASSALVAWVKFYGEMTLEEHWCEVQLGVPGDWRQRLSERVVADERVWKIESKLVSISLVDRVEKFIVKLLKMQAEDHDDVWCVEDSILKKCAHMASPPVVRVALERLLKPGEGQPVVVTINGMLAIASEQTQLSKKQRANMRRVMALFEGTRTPPSNKEVAERLSLSLDSVNSLTRHATQQRVLTEFASGSYIATDVLADLLKELAGLLSERRQASVPEIKDLWQLSRKYAIPLLEYCDQNRLTQRQGDVRVAGTYLRHAVADPDA